MQIDVIRAKYDPNRAPIAPSSAKVYAVTAVGRDSGDEETDVFLADILLTGTDVDITYRIQNEMNPFVIAGVRHRAVRGPGVHSIQVLANVPEREEERIKTLFEQAVRL